MTREELYEYAEHLGYSNADVNLIINSSMYDEDQAISICKAIMPVAIVTGVTAIELVDLISKIYRPKVGPAQMGMALRKHFRTMKEDNNDTPK